jgi:hypothetical protein
VIDKDGVWTLIPLASFLWALGGSGPRYIRRYGLPVAVIAYGVLFKAPLWLALIEGVAAHLITRLGYGDKAHDRLKAFYAPYLFALGAVYGVSSIGFGIYYNNVRNVLIASLLCSLVFAITLISSRKINFPPHKFHEILTGLAIGLVYCLSING